ncbi:MAG: mechanosensitive ion channel [Gammaproteobacteria bacterium]|nr:mechanosensitive ion channel [Gammaproteobacteria bacterium]
MDISALVNSILNTLGEFLPKIAGALGILVIGWLVAVIVRAAIRKGLSLAGLNEKVSGDGEKKMDLEGGIAKGGYWIVIIMTLIAVFNVLDLELVSRPLENMVGQVLDYLPRIIGGGVLLLIAWLLATGARTLSSKALAATTLDDKLSAEAGMTPPSDNISNVVYWLILLLFLPAVLGAFQLGGLLDPVQGMVDKILNMLPNIFAAAVIGLVGWFVAKILRDLVSNLLAAAGADGIGEKAGLQGSVSISRLVGTVVFIFVFIPALIAALNALQIESISQPATEMLGLMMAAIPNIFAAAIILGIAWFVARLVANLLSNLLEGMGFNRLPEKVGLADAFTDDFTASKLVGSIIIFFAMLFATAEAANRLGFSQVNELVAMFIEFGGQIILGTVILSVGFWLANLVYQGISKVGGANSAAMANIARIAILGLVTAMGLRAMGIANDIVNMAFALTLGSVAVAVALSFGLGGREAAGKQMEYWLAKTRD